MAIVLVLLSIALLVVSTLPANLPSDNNTSNPPVFISAVLSGDIRQLQTLLEQHDKQDDTTLNQMDGSGMTAVMHAVEQDQSDMIHLLVQACADLSVKDSRGRTAYSIALDMGVLDSSPILSVLNPHPTCSICLGDIIETNQCIPSPAHSDSNGNGDHETKTDLSQIFVSECHHKFHQSCIDNWLRLPQSKSSCPLCRHALPPLPNLPAAEGVVERQIVDTLLENYRNPQDAQVIGILRHDHNRPIALLTPLPSQQPFIISPFHVAVMAARPLVLAEMFEMGGRGMLEELEMNSPSPLLYIAKLPRVLIHGFNFHTFAQFLMDNGVNLVNADRSGVTPLMYFSGLPDATSLVYLLQRCPHDQIGVRDALGCDALCHALRTGRVHAQNTPVSVLRDNGANLTSYYDANAGSGLSRQTMAAGLDRDMFEFLGEGFGARRRSELMAGLTPLMIAAEMGDETRVAYLLGNGAYLEDFDGREETALFKASAKGRGNIVDMLLQHGADESSKERSIVSSNANALMSQLCHVADNGNSLSIDKQEVNAVNDNGRTALMFACSANSGNMAGRQNAYVSIGHRRVQELLDNGANFLLQDINGLSALMFAVKCGSVESVEILLEFESQWQQQAQGARNVLSPTGQSVGSIGLNDRWGKTALDYAVELGYRRIIELLQPL